MTNPVSFNISKDHTPTPIFDLFASTLTNALVSWDLKIPTREEALFSRLCEKLLQDIQAMDIYPWSRLDFTKKRM